MIEPLYSSGEKPLPSFRISYVGTLPTDSTADYRVRALQRLGQNVHAFHVENLLRGSRIMNYFQQRYLLGPFVHSINQALLKHVNQVRPEIVFLDKPKFLTPQTIERIKSQGAKVVIYMQDNPFGPRKDGGWQQFYRIYRMADLLCAIRASDVRRYEAESLPCIRTMFSYEPSVHFAPQPTWSDKDRDSEIAYIGHPHEQRPAFLLQLSEEYGLPVSISGYGWDKVLNDAQKKRYIRSGFLKGPAYREAIWRSKVNLSFVTQLNEDDIAHKSIEIAASGGFLLALRTPGHQACFEEDKEAVFFSTIEECAEKARYYLEHPDEREEIARRGHARAVQSAYSNDAQLSKILKYFA
uniref:Glycosyltransferase family 1 protein n=1 Tax=Acidobacterium capsulatum TaxID=33075 RepID=A0A7V5CS41_9BACT